MTENDLFDHIEPWSGQVPRGYRSNWLGAKIAAPFYAHWMSQDELKIILASDRIESNRRPVFGDGEAFFEQANTIRSVLAASRERYVMVELGGGNGPRCVDSALALRKLRPDLKPFLVVVEALPTYVEWCKHHFQANDLNPRDHWIINSIVSDEAIPVPFYLNPRGFGNQAGDPDVLDALSAISNDGPSAKKVLQQLIGRGVLIENGAISSGWPRKVVNLANFENWPMADLLQTTVNMGKSAEIGFVSALTLENIVAPLSHVDFMDVDIQHAELSVIPSGIETLNEKVRLLSIGTHTVEIHAALLQLFIGHSWEIIYDITPYGNHTRDGMTFFNHDGVLTVQNPSF